MALIQPDVTARNWPKSRMNWSTELYDLFRMKSDFGKVSLEETEVEVQFIQRALMLPDGARILDHCCGAGRHAIGLARNGFEVVGIDSSSAYLELARAKATAEQTRVTFVLGDVRIADYGSGYSGCISMFHSFGFFPDSEDALVLNRIATSLNEGGRFLIEILNRDWVLKNFEPTVSYEVEGVQVEECRVFNFLQSRCEFVIRRHERVGVVERKGSWRLYSFHELTALAQTVGLELADAFGSLDFKPFTLDCAMMRLVFQKQSRTIAAK